MNKIACALFSHSELPFIYQYSGEKVFNNAEAAVSTNDYLQHILTSSWRVSSVNIIIITLERYSALKASP